ncbi:MAG: SCP2 sterol-binding domain-containing protein [Candidatus Eremiobacteraeota bacterium]|nr:SCP2 sterol-binding domain-containing protein [Candidatus Eremiobacteraeota bacterium]MBV8583919.1 SCP2 sterol-binding domain-containing protein [Candidatus Eremiobacteraeota bacterium]
MAGFATVDDLRRVFGGFLQLVAEDDKTKLFAKSGMIVGYRLTDLDNALVVLDGTIEPQPGRHFGVYIDDPNAPKPAATFDLTSESLDDLYSGKLHAVQALALGKVRGHGKVNLAMKLLPAMARIIPLYKAYREKV